MSKQDRVYTRTASDLERKYNFGTKFADILGLATDAQTAADIAREAANKASSAVGDLDGKLTSEEIFNRLTNNGTSQGLYRDEKTGDIFINASYIAAGILSSADGKIQIDLTGGNVPVFNSSISTNGLVVRSDEAEAQKLVEVFAQRTPWGNYFGSLRFNGTNGAPIFLVSELFDSATHEPIGVTAEFANQTLDKLIDVLAGTGYAKFSFVTDGTEAGSVGVNDTSSFLNIDRINGKTVSWKSNGDGTYTLIGTD